MPNPQITKVILVEDHPLLRMGTRSVLTKLGDRISIVGEAESGEQLFSLLKHTTPDMVLLDIILPDTSGVKVAEQLRSMFPDIKILVLSSETSEATIMELIHVGIQGFINKNEPTQELLNAVESVICGIEYYGKDIARIIHDVSIAKSSPSVRFTDREIEIIRLCSEGYTGKQISDLINISVRTVDTHKTNIFNKLGIRNTVELIKYGLRNGIIVL